MAQSMESVLKELKDAEKKTQAMRAKLEKSLLAQLESLDKQRAEVAAKLEMLGHAVATPARRGRPKGSINGSGKGAKRGKRTGPSLRVAIARVLLDSDKAMSIDAIKEGVVKQGFAGAGKKSFAVAVNIQLSKFAKEKKVEKPERGMYGQTTKLKSEVADDATA